MSTDQPPWRIRFNAPFVAGNELAHIRHAVENGRLSGDGKYTRLCHAWLESRLGCHTALLTHSGTSALEMAALLCDICPGDEVIMPSFTFVSTANAFVLRGATPVFVDIGRESLNIDPQRIRDALTPRTRAIVPVHYGGVPCAMDDIVAIAAQHQLRVIEDAAHAVMARNSAQQLGTIGDLGCLSFHETKNIISGEGGALLVNNPELAERARILWEKGTNRDAFNRGTVDKYTWVDQGSSFLPSELTAAFLFGQLEQAECIIERRVTLCAGYRQRLQILQDRGLAQLPQTNPSGQENGHLFYLIVKDIAQRDRLIAHLKRAGIMAAFHYVPLHSSPGGQKYARHVGSMNVTNWASDGLLRLPMHNQLSEAEIAEVADSVLAYFQLPASA